MSSSKPAWKSTILWHTEVVCSFCLWGSETSRIPKGPGTQTQCEHWIIHGCVSYYAYGISLFTWYSYECLRKALYSVFVWVQRRKTQQGSSSFNFEQTVLPCICSASRDCQRAEKGKNYKNAEEQRLTSEAAIDCSGASGLWKEVWGTVGNALGKGIMKPWAPALFNSVGMNYQNWP